MNIISELHNDATVSATGIASGHDSSTYNSSEHKEMAAEADMIFFRLMGFESLVDHSRMDRTALKSRLDGLRSMALINHR